MGRGILGVVVENMLGDGDGFERIVAQRDLSFGNHGRGTRAAENFFEKTGAAAHFLELRHAQEFAALKKGRFLRQNLIEDGDGIIEILALHRDGALFKILAQGQRNFMQAFFRHEQSLVSTRQKIHCKSGVVLHLPGRR